MGREGLGAGNTPPHAGGTVTHLQIQWREIPKPHTTVDQPSYQISGSNRSPTVVVPSDPSTKAAQ